MLPEYFHVGFRVVVHVLVMSAQRNLFSVDLGNNPTDFRVCDKLGDSLDQCRVRRYDQVLEEGF